MLSKRFQDVSCIVCFGRSIYYFGMLVFKQSLYFRFSSCRYPGYEIISSREHITSSEMSTRRSEQSWRDVAEDVVLLSETDFLVCTFSSNVSAGVLLDITMCCFLSRICFNRAASFSIYKLIYAPLNIALVCFSSVDSPNFASPNILTSSKQQYLVRNTASKTAMSNPRCSRGFCAAQFRFSL